MHSSRTKLPPELSPILGRSCIASAPLRWLSGDAMPSPYRELLVHDKDMTSSLENFYEDAITLEVLQSERHSESYLREVVLHTASLGAPVEYGLIDIELGSFPEALHPLILGENLPLGQILNESGLRYQSEPHGFYEMDATHLADIFPTSSGSEILYGRYNHLTRADNSQVLARILEILPTSH